MEGLKRMFSYAGKQKGKLRGSMIFASISVLLGIVAYYLVYRVIMLFIGDKVPTLLNIAILAVAVLVALLVKAILIGVALKLSHENAFTILSELRKKLADKLIRMPMGLIKSKAAGVFKMHMVDDVESMETILAHLIPEGTGNVLAPICALIFLFVVDYRIALLALGAIPLGIVAFMAMFKDYKPKMDKFMQSNRYMNATIVEYISGMEVIKAFNQTTESYGKYTSSVEAFKNHVLVWMQHSWKYMTAYFVLLPASIMFVLPIGGLFYLNGSLDLGSYILGMLLTLSFAEPILRLTNFVDNIAMLIGKEKAINDILESDELKKDETTSRKPTDFGIKFDNVTFAYDDVDVLKGISFECEPNTVTALVGASGSGKSTIAKLVTRFWDTGSGSIQVGGVDITKLPFEELMESISYVSQDSFLFNDTIMENIRMGKPGASDEEVIEASKNAICHEFIAQTKHGYNTNAGDAGDRFSGGQKQRLAIARALIKDATIVILDEATAFTDPENEDKIQESINGLIKDKTVVVIAHRLSTIVDADNIIVVDDGNILAQGTHEELLESSPKYKNMWEMHMEAMSWDISTKGVC